MTNVSRSYEEFQPAMDLETRAGSDTLKVYLPAGFNKEHLRVHLDNSGNVKINGERQIQGNKWSRFAEEFAIPENINYGDMQARLEDGILYIVMPKTITWVDDTHQQTTPASAKDHSSVSTGKKTTSTADVSADKLTDSIVYSGSATDKKTTSSADAAADKQMDSVKDRGSITNKKTTSIAETVADKDRDGVKDKTTTSTADAAGYKQMESVKDSSSGTEKKNLLTDGYKKIVANATKETKKEEEKEYVYKGKLGDGGLLKDTYIHGEGGLVLAFDQTRQLMMNVLVAFLVLMALAIYVTYKFRSPK